MKLIGTLLNVFLLAGTCVLLIIVIGGGSTNHSPFNQIYFLRADTSSISGAAATSAWTFWGVCDYSDFSSCSLGPAYPISPVDNFRTEANVPEDFISSRNTYYYLSRFSFAFTLVGLCFTGIALIVDLLGFCLEIIDKVVMAFVSLALIFIAGNASMQTAVVVLARNAFQNDGHSAHVGVKAMALTWAAFACLLIIWFNTCFANIANSYKKHIARVGQNQYDDTEPAAADNDASSFTRAVPAAEPQPEDDNGGIRFFKIKRNNKVSDEESV